MTCDGEGISTCWARSGGNHHGNGDGRVKRCVPNQPSLNRPHVEPPPTNLLASPNPQVEVEGFTFHPPRCTRSGAPIPRYAPYLRSLADRMSK